ncbi:MAG: tetraacyldisaccharide 4'-kinase [Chromatiales bacterium]|nr:tetraacyldisaccharide 4'-kinase [Chromatiales bacterium]
MTKDQVEQWFLERWYRPKPVVWLRPLEALFRLVSAMRRLGYRLGLLKSESVGVPVLVVGNITVGGTGKTPLVLHLAECLQHRGVRVGIVSRGYGGSETVQKVTPDSLPADVGDEPLLLARRSGVPVWIGADRVAAARELVAEGVQTIISDDGLQHYRLARDAEIVVIDGQRSLGNGACIPAGPLRESPARLREVDMVVVNGDHEGRHPGSLVMGLRPDSVLPVNGRGARRSLDSFAGQTVHALAGIGNPERFFDSLRQQNIKVLPSPLPDHSRIMAADLTFDDRHEILMTEKDAVKCHEFAGSNAWYVPVTAQFSDSDQARLSRLLDDLIKCIPGG